MNTTDQAFSILITDDDPGSREAIREIVEPAGYRTVLASNGEEALDILREQPVHLAVLDVHMPRLTGPEVIEIAHQINAILPCILVTADANEEVMRQAFRVRAYSVIPKPISKNLFMHMMVRALMQVYGRMRQDPMNES